MEIKILGTGCCSNCATLYNMVKEKADELKSTATITKSDDINDIIASGVMSTPAVIIDGQTVHAGGMPSMEEIENWLK